jgi:hypothetical protein
MSAAVPARAFRALVTLLAAAFLVSVVHYADNTINYDDYPVATSGLNPSRTVVAVSWFAFTAFGVAGLLLFARGRPRAAGACLALYALSGLVGLGHYTIPGATDMPLWRQTHVVADILCGIAILAFAVWSIGQEKGRSTGLASGNPG